jgi:hypothetical protein
LRGAANDAWCIDFMGWFVTAMAPALRAVDAHRRYEPLSVALSGEIKWRGKLVYLNCALAGEPIGLAEDAAG